MKMNFSNNDNRAVARNIFPLYAQKHEPLGLGSPTDSKNMEKTMIINSMQTSMIGRLMNSRICRGCQK